MLSRHKSATIFIECSTFRASPDSDPTGSSVFSTRAWCRERTTAPHLVLVQVGEAVAVCIEHKHTSVHIRGGAPPDCKSAGTATVRHCAGRAGLVHVMPRRHMWSDYTRAGCLPGVRTEACPRWPCSACATCAAAVTWLRYLPPSIRRGRNVQTRAVAGIPPYHTQRILTRHPPPQPCQNEPCPSALQTSSTGL